MDNNDQEKSDVDEKTDVVENGHVVEKNDAVEKSDVYKRAFELADRVLKMERALSNDRSVNRKTMNQLVSTATSVGANLEEAKAAHSRADFHAKLRISLKEARESHYWLRLLSSSGIVTPSRLAPLVQEANEIVAILTVIAKKTNPKNPQTS